MDKPRLLFVDIETAPNTAYVWGLWDQNISHEHLVTSSYILCWSAKWSDEKAVRFESMWASGQMAMLRRVHTLLDEADIIIHFNGEKFDIPTLNKEFIKHGFKPPSPYKQVDMLRVCLQAFRFESNKLDAILKSLDLDGKVKHRGFQLWVGCMDGDKSCQKEMEVYNKQDVISLEQLYHRVLPWIEKHPNVGLYQDRPACTNCGSIRVQQRGTAVAVSRWYYRYHCQGCGKWFRGKQVVKHGTNK